MRIIWKSSLIFLVLGVIATNYASASAYGDFVSLSLSRTYTTDELQTLYTAKFCTTFESNNCQNIASIKQAPEFGGFDLSSNPISRNSDNIKSITNSKVVYTSPKALSADATNLSGKILMPEGIGKDAIKGVVLYFHPTVFDPDSMQKVTNNFSDDIVYAALYASQGYIVVLPDYNGLGDDYKEVHPYVLYPRINDLSGLYLLTAVRSIIDQKYGFSSTDKIKLFTTGFSEGAAYSIWFSRLVQTDKIFIDELAKNNYQLKASTAIDGAYDVSGTTKNFLFDNVSKANGNPYKIQSTALVNIVKPNLAAVAIMSYAYMSKSKDNASFDYSSMFNPKFFNMQCSPLIKKSNCQIDNQSMTLYQALRYAEAANDTAIINPIMNSALAKNQNGKSYVKTLAALITSSNNSLLALIDPKLESDAGFNQQLQSADITNWQTRLPIHFISLASDSVVSPVNTEVAGRGTTGVNPNLVKTTLIDNNLIKVDNIGNPYLDALPGVTDNVDHISAATFLNIISLNYFNSQQ